MSYKQFLSGDVDLPALDADLTSKTYLEGTKLSDADTQVFSAVYQKFVSLPATKQYKTPSLLRWFDHVQSLNPPSPNTPAVTFDLENAPKLERKVEPVVRKKKETAATPAAQADASTSNVEAVPAVEQNQKKEKKMKKEKDATVAGGKKEKGGGKAAAAPAEPENPAPWMIDLRVGKIVDVQKHPDADSLYVEKIDIGEPEGPRTVVSGLVKYVPIEQMQGATLVCVCNLKPANMRGVKSHAMVLCATSAAGKETEDGGVELIRAPEGALPGDRVVFEGFETSLPVAQLNPKKKIWETIQPGFITLPADSNRECAWVDPETKTTHKMVVAGKGVLVAPSFAGASLS